MRTLPLLAALLLLPLVEASATVMKVAELSGGALTIDGRAARVGQKLPSGKTARLARGATLIVDAAPWGKVLFHGPAVFTTLGGEEDGLALKAGGALSVLRKVEGRTFTVRTPAAAMAVRGTTFYAEARGPNSTYVCICDGTIDVESDSGSYHSTLTSQKKHRSVLLNFDGSQGLAADAQMEHHADEEIESLGGNMGK